MGLVEAVAGELLHEVEDLGRGGLLDAALGGALDEDRALALHLLDVLLAHPASTAYGLNLQAGGHNVVWFGLNWSLELYQQANARLYRQGQDKPVVVHHLVVQDSIDMDVIDALDAKKDGQDALLDAIKARVDKIRRNG